MESGHAVELSTIIDHPGGTRAAERAFDETFSKTMRKMLVQFAKTGTPSLSAEISPDGKAHERPLYDLENRQIMIFDELTFTPKRRLTERSLTGREPVS